MRALPGSVTDSTKTSADSMSPSTGFQSFMMVQPSHMNRPSDRYTCLVLIARPIATIGGMTETQPNEFTHALPSCRVVACCYAPLVSLRWRFATPTITSPSRFRNKRAPVGLGTRQLNGGVRFFRRSGLQK